ncbi:MAG TPA: WecB/TagA/CpsF family glycosyltransferase [Deltaproteobacteria bacterium]|nr:WecB/TagA/CpsF family glycosyltransferase [Deltaproteobacteria bacterium]
MSQDTIIVLGIPIDNLTMDETVSSVFKMIEDYEVDGRARQVATVNVDFVANTLSWRLQKVRHPELLDILRRADLVTADGMPIVWTSKLLGAPLKERVTGADLTPRLAEEAANRSKSLFFLGGKGDVGQKAADLLKSRYPRLKIAGVYSPFVHVEGEEIAEERDQDEEILRRVNHSGAHILLIGFGNPKQEVWFDRNRERLKIPVSIGIGGTFEFIVGSVARAPRWMQKTGLEWVFRITQDPKRLIKRYLIGMMKFGMMIWPAILYYRYRRFLFRLSIKKGKGAENRETAPEISAHGFIKVISLPDRLDAAYLERSRIDLENGLESAENWILDFAATRFLDSSGIGFVTSLWNRAKKEDKTFQMIGVDSTVARFFKLSRVWDLFAEKVFENMGEVMETLREKRDVASFSYSIEHASGHVLVHLFGRLDAAQVQNMPMESFKAELRDESCILDMEHIEFVDSSGIGFFIKIQKHVSGLKKSCILCAMSDNVTQMFRITKVMPLFQIVSDVAAARKKLETGDVKRRDA